MERKASCDCGWEYQTDDDDKLVQAVQEHAKAVHNMEGITREQALAQAKPV
jgi:predicted small metal-binding protein